MKNFRKKIATIIVMALLTSTFTSINISATENNKNTKENQNINTTKNNKNTKENQIKTLQSRARLKATSSRIYVTGVYNHISVFQVRVSDGTTLSVWDFYDTDTYVGYNHATNITAVGTLQASLNAFGYNLDVDFKFGPSTHSALIDFQKKNGLSVDGTAGPNTWKKLNSKLPAFK